MLNEKEFLKEISYITSKECESKEKSFEKIKEYIENGGDINIRSIRLRETALLRLSKINCIESIQIAILLIQNDKCDLNAQDVTGDSVLMNAIEHNNYEIAELLIKDKRCNLNLLNELHHSALIICCDNKDKSEKNTNIAKILIDNEDCNLNFRSVHGSYTALMIACLRKNYKIAELLIKNKRCNVNLRNSSGSTVLLYLQDRKKFRSMPELVDDLRIEEDLIDLLMQREDICFDEGELEGESFPIRAILSHDTKIINQLLSNKKFKLNLISLNTNFLHNIPVDTAKLFMQHKKFNWNALDYFKIPILYHLLHRGLSTFFIKEFEQAINDKECNINETNPQGDSLLMKVCLFDIQIDRTVLNQESLIELARVLINNDNCDINLKNKQGYTAFWYACKGNKKRIVKLFLQSKNFIIDETIVYPNDENLIIAFFAKKRNRIGTLLVSTKTYQKMDSKKRKTESMEENPFRILPKELIHLTLSYAYPFIPQKKYCKNE